ncbi:protein of unknown function [Candidatus Filomicrobium marinum]|uniref:Uncharacterized protein n=1 Tax=Candidatus Filomicrobium marinum TaxID=1608628 RepID=A0A0D6JEQ0_9HYPH|nr:protein of unknown function [Candidatus Filomicrobium marinum]CPR18069.1 protein of unknown function [Candidatus Filomicrobium marinum]
MNSLANFLTNFIGAGLGLPTGYQDEAPSCRNNPYSYCDLRAEFITCGTRCMFAVVVAQLSVSKVAWEEALGECDTGQRWVQGNQWRLCYSC